MTYIFYFLIFLSLLQVYRILRDHFRKKDHDERPGKKYIRRRFD